MAARGRPSVVFFDVGGTLLNFNIEPSQLFAKILAGHGVEAAPKDLYRTMREVEAAFPVPLGVSAKSEADYWRAYDARILARMGLPAEGPILEEVARRFKEELTLDPFPETVEVLEAVAGTGTPLGVISNASHGILADLERTGIARFFRHVVYSQEVGAAKPDERIFREALRRFQIAGSQAWHIGDNPEADIWGASRVGIRPFLVDRGSRHPEVPGERMGDLRGVLAALGEA